MSFNSYAFPFSVNCDFQSPEIPSLFKSTFFELAIAKIFSLILFRFSIFSAEAIICSIKVPPTVPCPKIAKLTFLEIPKISP